MTYEEYRDAWWARERQADADLRAGIMPGGERLPYRYIGPPMVPTSEHTIERAYLSRAQARAYAWCEALLRRALTIDDPPFVDRTAIYGAFMKNLPLRDWGRL